MPALTAEGAKLITLVNPSTGVTLQYRGRWLRPGKATTGDVKRGWARFPGDKVWLSLPPGVQKQLDAGRLQIASEYVARAEIEASQTPQSAMPRGNASHESWISYAVTQGMDREQAVTLTRDQIKGRFTAPVFDPEAAPEDIGAEYELLNAKS